MKPAIPDVDRIANDGIDESGECRRTAGEQRLQRFGALT